MNTLISLLLVLGVLAIFGLLVYYMVVSTRRESEKKRRVARSLGFRPFEAQPGLVERISRLYRHGDQSEQFELRDVSRRGMPDGELFLFDLVKTSGDDDRYPEEQAVAVLSPYLDLPDFVVFPKVDLDGKAAALANRVIEWTVKQFGTPVEFPEVPEFERLYVVSSPDPDRTYRYLNQIILHRLAQTRYLTIQAGGDVLVVGEMPLSGKSNTEAALSERVRQAMDIYSIFMSYGERSQPDDDLRSAIS